MSKQTSIELPNTHAENPVGQNVAVKRKRGRPAKKTTVKLDETINAKAVTLEELQKGDGGWFTIKPAETIVALC